MKPVTAFFIALLAGVGLFTMNAEAKRLPKARIVIFNEFPGNGKLIVGHSGWKQQIGIMPHRSGVLMLDVDEEHILRRKFFVNGVEMNDEYRIFVPKDAKTDTIVFGGLQVGILFNRCGQKIWVMPPTFQHVGFLVGNGNGGKDLNPEIERLRTILDQSVRSAFDSSLVSSGLAETLPKVIAEGATSSPALLDSFLLALKEAGVDIPQPVYYSAEKMARLKVKQDGQPVRGIDSSGVRADFILQDSLYTQGVPLNHGQGFVFAITPPEPVFVIFFDEKHERRKELRITDINFIPRDQNFGGVWVDWYHYIDPYLLDQARRRPW